MKQCEYYKGNEIISNTETRIKCPLMEGGGKTFDNKSEEGRDTVLRCWHGGDGCALKQTHEAPESEEHTDADELPGADGASLEALAGAFKSNEIKCPHFKNGGVCEPQPVFGGLEFKCALCEVHFADFAKASEFLAHCSENPEACVYYRNNPAPLDEEQISLDIGSAPVVAEVGSGELENRAARLHRQILVNSQIAAESIVAIAIDLRTMRDEKLYTYLGCADFNDYCEKKVGIKQRHAYNFIKVLDSYGEKQLADISHLGIAKLVELTALDNDDRQELINSGTVEEMSVRELKDKIRELENSCEQLTLDLGNQRSENELSLAEADELHNELEKLRDNYKKIIDENSDYKGTLDNYEKAIADLMAKNKELESRPVEVAVQPMSDEEKKKLCEQIRDEERTRAEKLQLIAERRHIDEMNKYKEKLREKTESLKSASATRKQEADNYAAEIERLKAENAALQSNAKSPAPAPNNAAAQVKFFMTECQRAFNSAMEAVRDISDTDKRDKFLVAMREAVKQMNNSLKK